MEHIQEFTCPGCGAKLEFNAAGQNMKCPYCDTEIAIDAISPEETEARESLWEPMSAGTWREGETDNMRIYTCRSCGGEIIAHETTGAASCPYCGNQVVMKEQFAGDLRPDFIIPFKHDRNAAKEAYRKHLEGKRFLPPVFKNSAHVDEIRGIYVPFWLYDADVEMEMTCTGEKVREYTEGDYDCREIKRYRLDRKGTVSYTHIPVDGSSKIDHILMESIEPFDKKGLVDFKTAYLAGYLADRYDIPQEKCAKRAQELMKKSTEDAFRASCSDYSSVNVEDSRFTVLGSGYWYALYPVWLLNTTWDGKKYTFAMNGQTGRLIGDLPADKGSYWKYVGIRAVIFGVIIYALMWIVSLF